MAIAGIIKGPRPDGFLFKGATLLLLYLLPYFTKCKTNTIPYVKWWHPIYHLHSCHSLLSHHLVFQSIDVQAILVRLKLKLKIRLRHHLHTLPLDTFHTLFNGVDLLLSIYTHFQHLKPCPHHLQPIVKVISASTAPLRITRGDWDWERPRAKENLQEG